MVNQEYQTLYEVAQVLQSSQELQPILTRVLEILICFEELKVENKAGIFLVDEAKKVLCKVDPLSRPKYSQIKVDSAKRSKSFI